uniref:Uncharacterized protein n=1 Tax=Oryza sativa subsp. japonica TaxID=39947 RepID=Q5VPS1_ORYSJ|nr:hypothetical protein [Oryza sativa Japonica Group]
MSNKINGAREDEKHNQCCYKRAKEQRVLAVGARAVEGAVRRLGTSAARWREERGQEHGSAIRRGLDDNRAQARRRGGSSYDEPRSGEPTASKLRLGDGKDDHG